MITVQVDFANCEKTHVAPIRKIDIIEKSQFDHDDSVDGELVSAIF